jgi:ABC-type antimicrobial peptide transport system permease subunit
LGGLLGATGATLLLIAATHMPNGTFFTGFKVNTPTYLVALAVAALVGLVSAVFPSYNASRRNIVDGLRHIG